MVWDRANQAPAGLVTPGNILPGSFEMVRLAQAKDTTKSELAGLQNQVRTISENGERIARVETALAGTRERVNRLHTQVTKNTDGITELKVRGTPE